MLNLKQNGTVLWAVAEGGWFSLPDGRMISPAHDGWTAGEYSLEAVPPPPLPTPEELLAAERASMRLSFAQLLIGLVTEGWITEAEGRAWRDRVALPAQVVAVISSLPASQQFAAETRAMAPSEVLRVDPLVSAMAAAAGKAEAEIDDFFRQYAGV